MIYPLTIKYKSCMYKIIQSPKQSTHDGYFDVEIANSRGKVFDKTDGFKTEDEAHKYARALITMEEFLISV